MKNTFPLASLRRQKIFQRQTPGVYLVSISSSVNLKKKKREKTICFSAYQKKKKKNQRLSYMF